jgi:serine/threonine protein kinase
MTRTTTKTLGTAFKEKSIFHKKLEEYGEVPYRYLVRCTNLKFPNGDIYLEYMSGSDLRRRMKDTSRPISIEMKLCWVEELASGVSFIASKGYAHGDLRLENVLVDDAEHVKLCDFGATVTIGEELQAFHVPFWDGDCDLASHESEQFALASCLYNIISGSEPYAELHSDQAIRLNKTIDLFRKSQYPEIDKLKLGVLEPLHLVSLKGWQRIYISIKTVREDIFANCSAIRESHPKMLLH